MLGLLVIALALPGTSQAASPALLPVRGFLSDAAGVPVDGNHDLRFVIYDGVASGTALFTENHAALAVSHGEFVAYLGQVTGSLDLTLFRDKGALWLEVTIDGTQAIQPRFRLATAPYAAFAQYCGDAVTLGGSPVTAFAQSVHTHQWTDLTGVPATLLDGDQDTLASLSCASGQVAKWNASAWNCADDANSGGTITGVTAGTGLSGGGASGGISVALDTAYTDGRYWTLGGNAGTTPGTQYIGTSDNVALELRVNNTRALRIEPMNGGANIIAGHPANWITAGIKSATIAGGGNAVWPNRVTDDESTVGGGVGNQAGNASGSAQDGYRATVAGGTLNTASGQGSFIGGGEWNSARGSDAAIGGGGSNDASGGNSAILGGYLNAASGTWSTVAGGQYNTASGQGAAVPGGAQNAASGSNSFAAGYRAKANTDGCFVWGDSSNSDVTCTTADRWVARASGGVYFYSNSGLTAGSYLAAGSGTWSSVSDRNEKADIAPVEPRRVLEALARVPVSTWRYRSERPGVRHMGPMAQDFHAAFGVGDSERHITTIDADGVALAAVKGLHEVAAESKREIVELRRENGALRARLDRLEQRTLPWTSGAGYFWPGAGLLGIGLVVARRTKARRGPAVFGATARRR
ncbi:MAG TPA: tail fiber domain-containing protein [Polyangia bacterium]|jgi:hypothetical protein